MKTAIIWLLLLTATCLAQGDYVRISTTYNLSYQWHLDSLPTTYLTITAAANSNTPGDLTGDHEVTASDIITLVRYVFRGGPQPQTPVQPYITITKDSTTYQGDMAIIETTTP